MCLLLGASGVGKTLLVKRLQNILPGRREGRRGAPGAGVGTPSAALVLDRSAQLSSRDARGDVGAPPPTQPTVGTNLTDIVVQRRITIRELGGCMGPIWSSYYGNCRCLLVGPAPSHSPAGRSGPGDGHWSAPRGEPTPPACSLRGRRLWPSAQAAARLPCLPGPGLRCSARFQGCVPPQFMVDASNPTQLSAACVQLLGLLSAEQLAGASVLILFNKMCGPGRGRGRGARGGAALPDGGRCVPAATCPVT